MQRWTGSLHLSIHFSDMRLLLLITSLIACSLGVGSFQAHAQQNQQAQSKRLVVKRVEPAYPPIALRAGLSGNVRLELTVAPDGSAQSIRVLGGNPILIKAATEAINNWRWTQASTHSNETVQLTFGKP